MNAPAPAPAKQPIVVFKDQLDQRMEQFKHALPAHMPPERFARVVLTAVQNNPDLLNADRQALWNSCMRAAQDGLLPDGREGAIVIFNTKENGAWVKKAQWMPMVYGIVKKARNSGQLAMITARVVYEGDKYRYWLDEEGEHLIYEPSENPNREVVRLVFAAAKTKEGELLVEPLTPGDIEKIRNVSRAKDKGPWVDWWEEMAKKSAIRRLSKRLPMSSDLDDLVRRDDDLYDFDAARTPASRVVNFDTLGGGAPIDRQPPAPPITHQNEAAGEAEADTAQAPAGGSESAPAASNNQVAPPQALHGLVHALIKGADTIDDINAIETLLADEFAAAPADLAEAQRAAIKEARAKFEADDFPGDRPPPQ